MCRICVYLKKNLRNIGRIISKKRNSIYHTYNYSIDRSFEDIDIEEALTLERLPWADEWFKQRVRRGYGRSRIIARIQSLAQLPLTVMVAIFTNNDDKSNKR